MIRHHSQLWPIPATHECQFWEITRNRLALASHALAMSHRRAPGRRRRLYTSLALKIQRIKRWIHELDVAKKSGRRSTRLIHRDRVI